MLMQPAYRLSTCSRVHLFDPWSFYLPTSPSGPQLCPFAPAVPWSGPLCSHSERQLDPCLVHTEPAHLYQLTSEISSSVSFYNSHTHIERHDYQVQEMLLVIQIGMKEAVLDSARSSRKNGVIWEVAGVQLLCLRTYCGTIPHFHLFNLSL